MRKVCCYGNGRANGMSFSRDETATVINKDNSRRTETGKDVQEKGSRNDCNVSADDRLAVYEEKDSVENEDYDK
jgi:hypothetical protein